MRWWRSLWGGERYSVERLALLAGSVMASDVGCDYKRNHTYLWSPAALCTSITLLYLRQSGREIDLHIKGAQLPVLSIERVSVFLYIGLFPIICGYVQEVVCMS